MAPSRRDKVRKLLAEAQSVPPEEREPFLRERCEEESVREEVASLLKAQEAASGFYEALADSVVAPLLGELDAGDTEDPRSEDSDLLGLKGSRIGRYVVEEHLGGGGMGIVYRARDPELGRAVALKFLPPHLSGRPEAEERFVREARAAAALDHAHIATIHEIGRAEAGEDEGQRYIAMAYYEGETLKEKLEREGPLPIGEALRYAEQIAESLSAAHEAGIVHRDVKPANVMVTEEGEGKLLDFGLARLAEATRLTGTGQQLGTIGYMSPEQVEGEEVGPAADLWALGALLYEMLAGERPFEGERRAAILHAVLHEEPASLAERRPEVPAGLGQVVHRCLQKDPVDRYGSAAALREDLRGMAREKQSSPSGARKQDTTERARWSRRGAFSAVAVLILVLAGAISWALWPVGETDGGPSSSTVAVLPFEVSGAGAETWRDGMVTALTLNLDGAAELRAIPDRTVLAAWKNRTSSDEATSVENALAVAREVGAKYALVGSAVQLGTVLRLGVVIRRTATGERLGNVEVEGKPDSVTVLTDRLTRRVLEVLLRRSGETIPSVNLSSITTRSLPAFKAFLEGERHFRAGAYAAAVRDFGRATDKDTSFALAYARLERSLAWSGQEGQAQALRQACRLNESLPTRTRRIVTVRCRGGLERRDMTIVDTLRRLSEDYPQDPHVWYSLGEALFHGWVPGGWRESEEAFRQAVQLDSGAAPYQHHLDDLVLALHHDSARATQQIKDYPQGNLRNMYQVFSTLIFGDASGRQAAWSRLDSLPLPETRFPYWVRWPLLHPEDLALQERVIRQIVQREEVRRGPYIEIMAENYLLRGKVEALRPLLQNEANREEAECLLAAGLSLEYPIPDSLLRAHLRPSTMGTEASTNQLLCAGIYLVEQGDREGIPELMVVLGKAIARASETSEEARNRMQVVSNELKGYQAWKTGRLERATRLWSASKWSWWWWAGATSALWRGHLYHDLGKLRKAEDWYQAAWQIPLAHDRLGRLYEEMGRPQEAAEAYKRFIAAWENADPELQDRVTQIRERLDALAEKKTTE